MSSVDATAPLRQRAGNSLPNVARRRCSRIGDLTPNIRQSSAMLIRPPSSALHRRSHSNTTWFAPLSDSSLPTASPTVESRYDIEFQDVARLHSPTVRGVVVEKISAK